MSSFTVTIAIDGEEKETHEITTFKEVSVALRSILTLIRTTAAERLEQRQGINAKKG